MFTLHKNRADLLNQTIKIMHPLNCGNLGEPRLEFSITDGLCLQFFPAAAVQ